MEAPGGGPATSQFADFASTLSFTLDPFQEQAIAALQDHAGVLVSAPTSSGKTVVA